MAKELTHLDDYIFDVLGMNISNVYHEKETGDYCGYTFNIGTLSIKYRKAKVTPKKIGQFVALWKRNAEGKTVPYHVADNFDFYMVETESEDKRGCFMFSKNILADKQILSANDKEGKRGFRVYPVWDIPENKQAINTKNWQMLHFIDLINDRKSSAERFLKLVNL